LRRVFSTIDIVWFFALLIFSTLSGIFFKRTLDKVREALYIPAHASSEASKLLDTGD
jgi:hypothetical protein